MVEVAQARVLTLADVPHLKAGTDTDAAVEELVFEDDLRARDFLSDIGAMLRPLTKRFVNLFDSADFSYKIKLGEEWHEIGGDQDDATLYNFFAVAETRQKPYLHYLKAIETAYRRPARPFSQDTPEGWWAMRELLSELTEKQLFHYEVEKSCGMLPDCVVTLTDYGGPGEFIRRGIGRAETLPLAACRAALAAVLSEGVK